MYYEEYMQEKSAKKDLPGHTVFVSLLLVVLVSIGIFVWMAWYISGALPKPLAAFSSPVTTGPKDLTLNVTSPDDLTVVFDKQLTLAGTTLPKVTVVISSENDDYVFNSSAGGSFSKDLNLVAGLNTLTVTVFNDKGDSKQVTKRIYYSGEQLWES